MNRAQRIAEQLGMSQGAANHRLRKNILFSLLEKLAANRCHSCGLWIDTVDELSIEHIKPWEGRDAELFWDIDNIAFSHVQCNKPHIYHGRKPMVGPEGTAWCYRCQSFYSVDDFYIDVSRRNGLRNQCKQCHKDSRK